MRLPFFTFMPYSYDYFKDEFLEHLKNRFDSSMNILDVGPGSGSYGIRLREHFKNIDACEIYEPYVSQFVLKEIYKSVYVNNIVYFDYNAYDYIILGDILEHLSINDAQNLIKDISEHRNYCMVAIPYMMEQGEVGGNIYETHLQPDLTHEIFLNRYPQMRLLFKNDVYGMYVNYP